MNSNHLDGDDEQSIPPAYARKVCNGFGQLGARGISVIFSSGDFGVGATGACTSNGPDVSLVPPSNISIPYI